MPTEYQTMTYIIDMMRMAKRKSGYSDATLVADMNSFSGRGWSAGTLTALLAGRTKPTDEVADVITQYLLKRFYQYNYS